MLEDVKLAIEFLYQGYVKPFIEVYVLILMLFLIAGLSIVVLGRDNPVEKEVEQVIEEEIKILDPAISSVT